MQNFDIEKYLDGKMSSAELNALKAEMAANPDFANEVDMAEQLTEDIDMQSMRNELNSILKDGKNANKNKNGKWLPFLAFLTVIFIGAYFLMDNFNAPSSPVEVPTKTQSTPPIEEPQIENSIEENNTIPTIENNTKTAAPEKKKVEKKKVEKKKNIPIAENNTPTQIAPPLFPSPKLRGQNEGNEAWQKLLDQVWYTKFPPADASFSEPYMEAADLLKEREFTKAFTKLEILGFSVSENDTLSYLKGYCLTEMGEGKDAIRYFDGLKNTPENWKAYVEWHRALNVLNSEGIKAALLYFKAIEKSENHIFQKESMHTVKLLEDNL